MEPISIALLVGVLGYLRDGLKKWVVKLMSNSSSERIVGD